MAEFFITPAGEFIYPWINRADTQFNEEGIYKVDLALDGADAEKLKAKIEGAAKQALNEHIAEMKPGQAQKWKLYLPYENEVDNETGEPTGRTLFHFKQNAKIKTKDGGVKDIAIEIRDSKDNTVDVNIWAGTVGRIMFSMRPITIASTSKAGVRLDFAKVQIIKLQQGSGSSRGFGDADVDDGFVASSEDAGFGEGDDNGGDY